MQHLLSPPAWSHFGPLSMLAYSFRVCSMFGTSKFWAAKMPVQVPMATPSTAEERSLATM